MLTCPSNGKIFVYPVHVDLRSGFEKLSFLVETGLGEDVTSGSFFVFLNKRRKMMKILYYDQDGLAIWYKRLERGSFGNPPNEKELDRRAFLLLLEGVVPKSLNRRYKMS